MYQVGIYAIIDPKCYETTVEDIVSLREVSVLHHDTGSGKTLLMLSVCDSARFYELFHYLANINAVLAVDVLFSFNDTESAYSTEYRDLEEETSLSGHWKPIIYVEH